MSVSVWDGTVEKTGVPTVWDGTTELPATLTFSAESYPTVAAMLATQPFYVAHRGGSLDWPEHSMMAYANSIAWGCTAVEMSVNRTSDGVWVALHDADLNRTSMTSGLPALSQMTWAQVQNYRIKVTNGNEPYEKMTDILDRYQDSHIFFLDPKMGYNFRSEFFAIVKSFPHWEKHVMKYFHTGTTFAAEARAHGWTTWGYYYQADVPQIPTTSPYWDILGMDYTANQASWDAIKVPGKPVIGHILPSASAATIALGYGSRGLMCSGVKAIVPHTSAIPVLDRTNVMPNPSLASSVAGWGTNDGALYAGSRDTTAPISAPASFLSTRLADTLTGTNLALNPNLETNTTGWNTNSVAAYPTTLDTASAMSGINSLRSDRTATSLSTACASIQLATAGTSSAGFPCTPGVPMTISINVKCSLANRRVSMSYQWLDGANALISSTTPTNKVSDTGAALTTVRAVNTETPPFGAVTCRPIVTLATLGGNATVGEQVWFDNLLVEKDLTATSTVDRTNLMPNPSLGGGSASYWASGTPANYPVTVDSTAPIAGTYSAMATRTATSPSRFTISLELMGLSPGSAMPCTPGTPLFAAVDVKAELAGRRVQLYFEWFNAAGTYLSDSTRSAFTALTAGQVSRPTYSTTPPAGAVGARAVVNCDVADLSNATTGERTWLDNVYVGTGSDTSRFDGATAPAGDNWYRWTGAADASTSERLLIANRSAPSTYYDGGTPGTTTYDYRWSGTANASTSERRSVSANGIVSSCYTTAAPAATGGIPIAPGPVTLGLTVKTEKPNRRVDLIMYWVESGIYTTRSIVIPATAANTPTRVHATFTAPAGTLTCYPTFEVLQGSGAVITNGERVWWDDMTVEQGTTDGSYFDGSTTPVMPYTYSWTGTANASASQRWVQ